MEKRVIVEGVQILDDTLYPNKDFFADKPVIVVGTNKLLSSIRASIRDGETFIDNVNTYMKWYAQMDRQIKDLERVSNTKKGYKYLYSR